MKINSIIDLVKDLDTSRQTKNLNKLLIRILLHLQVEFSIHRGRPLDKIGAHCQGHNRHSIGICYEGGLDSNHKPSDTRTLPQKASLVALLRELKQMFPNVLVVGHHDLNPMKECPCFDAVTEYRGL